MYKLVALDLDGTLLNDEHVISKENIETITHLKHQGVQFVIVTGRSDLMAKEYVKTLNIEAPVLGNNGASVRNVMTDTLLYESKLSMEKVKAIHAYLAKKNIYFRCYSLDAVFSFNQDEFDESKSPYAAFSKKLAQSMDFHILNNFEELEAMNIDILRCMCATQDPEALVTIQRDLLELTHDEVFTTSKTSIDVVAKGASKGIALKNYGHSLGISPDAMVAIGDSGNDLSMLELVGMPVTLENGDDAIKKVVKLIAKNNNDSGVADALKTIFNLQDKQ